MEFDDNVPETVRLECAGELCPRFNGEHCIDSTGRLFSVVYDSASDDGCGDQTGELSDLSVGAASYQQLCWVPYLGRIPLGFRLEVYDPKNVDIDEIVAQLQGGVVDAPVHVIAYGIDDDQ